MVDEVLQTFLEDNKVGGWWSTTHGLENGLKKSIMGESKWMVDEVHALGLWILISTQLDLELLNGLRLEFLPLGHPLATIVDTLYFL